MIILSAALLSIISFLIGCAYTNHRIETERQKQIKSIADQLKKREDAIAAEYQRRVENLVKLNNLIEPRFP